MNLLKKSLLVTLSLTTAFSFSFVTPSYASESVENTQNGPTNNEPKEEEKKPEENPEEKKEEEKPSEEEKPKEKKEEEKKDDQSVIINDNNIVTNEQKKENEEQTTLIEQPSSSMLSKVQHGLSWLTLTSLVCSLGFTVTSLVLNLVDRVTGR